MYKRILIPLDGSPAAEKALPYAVNLAKQYQAEVVLLKILKYIPRGYELLRASIKHAEELLGPIGDRYLENIAQGIKECGIPVEVVAYEGDPRVEIVRSSATNQVDLTIMGMSGRSWPKRCLLGSVTDSVMCKTNIPVLLVPAEKKEIQRKRH
jgi:nucleotide-binding universal stress UspA family protein